MDVSFTIQSTELKPYTYHSPFINRTGGSLALIEAPNSSDIKIKKLTLLNLVGRSTGGEIVSYEPLNCVNRFLMAHHIDDGRQESDQYSKALIHYFSFILKLQEAWDDEYGTDVHDDEHSVMKRPTWDYMAVRKNQRLTYQYRAALKSLVIDEVNPDKRLARTTATAYMGAVIKFYSYHLRHGYPFNNPPFDHEIINIHFDAPASSMKPYLSKAVHTTDLRLTFPKSKRNEGGKLPSSRRDLRPLTNAEWSAVEKVLLDTRLVIKQIDGEVKYFRFAIEYCLFFLVCRFTGLRREEVASLHLGQILKPDFNKPMLRLGVGQEYGSLTKTKGDGNKSRKTIIPSSIMQKLFEYSISDRYRARLEKFKGLYNEKSSHEGLDSVDPKKDYLFISQTGRPFFTKLTEVNTRWNEIRNTVKHNTGFEIQGTPHNLRATFAVSLFRVLLRVTKPDIALAQVSECLGHDDEATTLLYLKIAQDEPTGDEIYEDVLDYLGAFDIADSDLRDSGTGE